MVLFLGSCEESQPSGPTESVSFISFLDKGAVVPDPVSTLDVIDSEYIVEISSQSGSVFGSWFSRIESRDYSQLASVVQINHLFGAPDPPIVSGRCEGARGLIVVIAADGLVDTLEIAGVVRCDTTSWPAGLSSLVSLKDKLVKKYRP